MSDFPSVTLEAVADALPSFGRTLILTHVNPDPDCIGSALALREMLRASGADAKVVCPTPIPHYTAFLPALCGLTPEHLSPEPADG